MTDKKISKIGDPRLSEYTQRTRSGRIQVFYTGTDNRDFARYKAEGGGTGVAVEMHDKPDVIRLEPPERHWYAELIDGEWWWLNGCGECNGEPRSWSTYIECEKHNVCRTCEIPRAELKEPPWGGANGWQCKPCADAEREALKRERLLAVAEKEYDEYDYMNRGRVVCPHCETAYSPDDPESSEEKECEICGGKYSLEVEYEVRYSTTVIGERLQS